MSAGSAHRLVVATYNVHGCIGADGRHDPERTASVIAELRPDVIALQEVDSRAGVEGGIDQFELLARSTGLRAIEGPTLHDHRGHYGNALLTRLPVASSRRIDLSVCRREPRGALDVELLAGGQRLRAIATHLGLDWRERRRQVARLLALLRSAPDTLTVLLGDMNEWLPMAHSLGPLSRHFGGSRRLRTYPARRPLLPLDRVWVRPAAALRALRVHASTLARVASDHLPLRAELALHTPAAAGAGEERCDGRG